MLRFVSICLLLSAVAHALAASVRADGATIVVNEVSVLTLRATVGKSGPSERARVLAAKLAKRTSLDLDVTTAAKSAKIFSAGELIILVNKQEGASHGISPAALASAWSRSLQSAWELPAIKLSKEAVNLPINGTATISVVGSEARTAPLTVADKAVSTVVRKGATLTITATGQGQTIIGVGEGDDTRAITVRVLPYAADFPQSYSATVIGAPTSGATVKSVIEGVLRTRFQGTQGVQPAWGSIPAEELGSGDRKTFAVRVKATAPNAYEAEGIVNVSVSNLGLALRRETELWYCNDPENVKKPQSLFMASLRKEEPVRMLYHHINESGQGLFIRVLVSNLSDKPASVVVLPGDSKDKNPVLAGVLAADPFFRSWLTGSGEVVTVPPRSALPIAFRRLAPKETSSGLCYLRLLSGGPDDLSVTAEAVAPYELDERWQAAMRTPTPWREVGTPTDLIPSYASTHSDVIYPVPFKQEQFTYLAGGNFSFFQIGMKPIQRREPGQALDGNFGVIYNIVAKAENPTQNSVDLELVFEASAGYSGALFSLDGQIVRLPLMQPKEEARLARFKLDPGESKTINVTTIPLSGSSYPATLVLRPVSKLPGIGK